MIRLNSVKCNKCGDVIVSKHRHDFVWCSCGAVAVDGGDGYLKRCGNLKDWEELSIADNYEKFDRKAYFESQKRSKA